MGKKWKTGAISPPYEVMLASAIASQIVNTTTENTIKMDSRAAIFQATT